MATRRPQSSATCPCPECGEGDRPGSIEIEYAAHDLALTPSTRWEECDTCNGTGEVPACEECGEDLHAYEDGPVCERCETAWCKRCDESPAAPGDEYCRDCQDGMREDHEEVRAEARREARKLGEDR